MHRIPVALTRRQLLTAGGTPLAGMTSGRAATDDPHSGSLRAEVVAILRSDFPNVVVTLDPDPSRSASAAAFDPRDVDQATIERTAIANLAKASEGVEVHSSATGTRGKFATHADESGDAGARLPVPMVMDQIREGLGTPSIVVAIPARAVLIAWKPDSEFEPNLAQSVAKFVREGPDSRGTELFADSSQGLRPLTPPELGEHGRRSRWDFADSAPHPLARGLRIGQGALRLGV